MPFVLVELALRQGVDRRAALYGNIGNDETLVVERQVAVDGLWEHAVAAVEEEDEEENDGDQDTELYARPYLQW